MSDDLRGRQLRLLELFVVILDSLPLQEQHVLLQALRVLTRDDVRGERRHYLVGHRRAQQTRQMRALLVQVSVVDRQHTVLQDQILVTGLTRDCLYQFRERLGFPKGLDSFRGWWDVEH